MKLFREKKEYGTSLVNAVLIVAIVLCSVFIFFLLKGNGNSEENIAKDGNIYEFSTSTRTNSIVNKLKDNGNQYTNTSLNVKNLENNNENTTTDSEDYKKYFYNQLNSNAKSIYSQIVNNFDLLKAGDKTIDFSNDTADADTNFQTAWDALMLDNPNIFFINTNNITLQSKSDRKIWEKTPKYSYKLMPKQAKKYYMDKWQTQDEVENAIKEVNEKAKNIIASAKGSRYDKVKYIHDYIVDNAEYDNSDRTNNGNIYGLLIEKNAVCEGYAKTFQYLLDLLDIPNIIVYGEGINSNNNAEYHSWNYVQMDNGKWYAVDTTWDDPIVIGNGRITEDIKHEYFLKGSNSFFNKHKESNDVSGTGQNFKYIEISKTDY